MATLGEAGIQFPDLTRPAVNPWFIAFTVMLATFMEVLDTSTAMLAFIDVFWRLVPGHGSSQVLHQIRPVLARNRLRPLILRALIRRSLIILSTRYARRSCRGFTVSLLQRRFQEAICVDA
jgi:hypothetical protein